MIDEDRYLLPVYARQKIVPTHGEGVWLHTEDGRRVLDLYGGHAVCALGYGHPAVKTALAAQTERLVFQSNAVELDVRARAAKKLVAFAPDGLDRAFFVNTGAEANENALRLAFLTTGRRKVVAVERGFHGRTAAAGAVTWGSDKWYAFPSKPFDVTFVPIDDVDALGAAIDRDTAAVIFEPVQGIGGCRDLDPAFVRAARERTVDAGAVLIFDEVQCGMGRTGHPFAADGYGVTPDILTAAKGIASGYPAGAVLVNAGVAEAATLGTLGTTFGGGPCACAMIEAVIDTIEREDLLENVRERSAEIRERCVVGPVIAVQGAGLLLGLRTSRPAKEIIAALLERDLLVGGASDPNIVRILAPLTLESAHVDLLANALAELPADAAPKGTEA